MHPQVTWPLFWRIQNAEEETMLAAMTLNKVKSIKWKKTGDFLADQATVATYPVMNDKMLLNDALQLTTAWGGVFRGLYYPDMEDMLQSSVGASRLQRYR